jgi:glutamine cyclotransferase
LTYDGTYLIASDGSDRLTYFDLPVKADGTVDAESKSLTVAKELRVTEAAAPVSLLNELEFAEGSILANVWYTNTLVKIDPVSGEIVGKADLALLYPPAERTKLADCLNGIALNRSDNTLLLTGKLWPNYYSVKIFFESGKKSKSAEKELRREILQA